MDLDISYQTQRNVGIGAGLGLSTGGALSLGLIHGIAIASGIGIPLILFALAAFYAAAKTHKAGVAEDHLKKAKDLEDKEKLARYASLMKMLNQAQVHELEAQNRSLEAEIVVPMTGVELQLAQARDLRNCTTYFNPLLDGRG